MFPVAALDQLNSTSRYERNDMRRDDVFPSRWLKATDLAGPCRAIIARCDMEKVSQDGDEKPVIYFNRAQQEIVKTKGFVLNGTNWDAIEALHGGDSDGWLGKEITIYPTTTRFQGKTVPCLRVDDRPQETPAKPERPSAVTRQNGSDPIGKPKKMFDERHPPPDDMNDEIPF
jgi:hypothetical protein